MGRRREAVDSISRLCSGEPSQGIPVRRQKILVATSIATSAGGEGSEVTDSAFAPPCAGTLASTSDPRSCGQPQVKRGTICTQLPPSTPDGPREVLHSGHLGPSGSWAFAHTP